MSAGRVVGGLFLAILVAGPFLPLGVTREYTIHVAVQIFIWSFIAGAWSLMGRFGLVSLGHG
ncbi:MAG: branched-chain amino acid ABC transporter permease, partial [Actinomycetota bacterium]